MKQLPNGLTVFNSTPHPITFWREDWNDVEIVEPDEIISAVPTESIYDYVFAVEYGDDGSVFDSDNVRLVRTEFVGTYAGQEVIDRARQMGANLIVGSLIAAQGYPGQVVAITPAPGYERIGDHTKKRMNPDKFTIFPNTD